MFVAGLIAFVVDIVAFVVGDVVGDVNVFLDVTWSSGGISLQAYRSTFSKTGKEE